MTYLRFTSDLEDISPQEAETFEQIAQTFKTMGEQVAFQEGRAVRVSHAKATAGLKATLLIADNLAPN